MEMLSVQRKWYSTDSFLIVAQKLPPQQLADNSYVSIYCKNKNIIEKLYFNALQNDFEDVQFITDENDTRTSLTV